MPIEIGEDQKNLLEAATGQRDVQCAVNTRLVISQDQVAAVENSIRDIEGALQEQLRGYREKIALLGEYEPLYFDHAFATLKETELSSRERTVLELVGLHAREFAEVRRADTETWLAAFEERFGDFKD